MKFVFYVLMIPLAFFVGKSFYPILFGGSDSDSTAVETVVDIKVRSPMGMVTETIDYHDIDPEDYPDKVTLAEPTILTDQNGLSPLKLDPGSPVKPLLLDEMTLEVTSPLATHLVGEVSVLDTDFAEGVAKKRMARRLALSEASRPAVVSDVPVPEPVIAAVAPTPKPAPTAASSDMGGGSDEPAPEPEAPSKSDGAATLSAEQIVAAMKTSLEGGKIEELDASKVSNWEAMEDESFDGEQFQVGVATYQEMTILGEKTLQAKALFREGKLDKWIHAKTGMQIR